jgi:hypothetical protein
MMGLGCGAFVVETFHGHRLDEIRNVSLYNSPVEELLLILTDS